MTAKGGCFTVGPPGSPVGIHLNSPVAYRKNTEMGELSAEHGKTQLEAELKPSGRGLNDHHGLQVLFLGLEIVAPSKSHK